MITVGSLFSGIGGLDLGLEWAGMEVRWQCEKDAFCRDILQTRWPGIPCIEDVRDVRAGSVEPVDLVCGGFPCQPHSLAGKRKGAGDDRDLWPEFRRVVAELKPTWVVGENVPGIYGPFLDGVLADLESLGYRALVFEIPACAVDAPHRRARVFIVAHSDECTRERRITQPAFGNVPRSDGESVAHASSERRQQDAGSAPTDEGEDAGRASQRDHVASGDGEAHAVGLADSDHLGQQGERSDGVLNGERSSCGHDADGCGEPGSVEQSASERRREGRTESTREQGRSAPTSASGLGDASRELYDGGGESGARRGRQPTDASNVGHPESIGRERRTDSENARGGQRSPRYTSPWSDAEWIACGDGKARRVKPGLRLLAHGIPGRVDKLRALGNAVVPQVAEVLGKMIVAADGA